MNVKEVEVVMTYFNVLFQHLCGITEENLEEPWDI
jgi:hypothetical protein